MRSTMAFLPVLSRQSPSGRPTQRSSAPIRRAATPASSRRIVAMASGSVPSAFDTRPSVRTAIATCPPWRTCRISVPAPPMASSSGCGATQSTRLSVEVHRVQRPPESVREALDASELQRLSAPDEPRALAARSTARATGPHSDDIEVASLEPRGSWKVAPQIDRLYRKGRTAGQEPGCKGCGLEIGPRLDEQGRPHAPGFTKPPARTGEKLPSGATIERDDFADEPGGGLGGLGPPTEGRGA